MSRPPLPYADLDSTRQMHADCDACAAQMRLRPPTDVTGKVLRGAPSIRYEDYPREVLKPEIEVSEAAARLAARLHLHLD